MREITTQDKYSWIRLEVQCNSETYPQLVKQGLMTQQEAAYYLAIQHHILNDYELQREEDCTRFDPLDASP